MQKFIPKKKSFHHISEHFSQRDFTCKCSNCNNNNNPGFKISLGLIGALELLRSLAHERITILKGYTCTENDEPVFKKKNYHNLGLAADIRIENTPLTKAFALAEQIPEFKGIGINFTENYLHVETKKDTERSLWAIKLGKKTEINDQNRTELLGT